MAASFPTNVKSFTTKVDGPGNVISASHVNDLQDEVVAVETWLLGQAWTAYSPTLTNVTLGSGTKSGKYFRVGKMVHFKVHVTLAADSSINNSVIISLPVASGGQNSEFIGIGTARDTGNAHYPLYVVLASPTTAVLQVQTTSQTHVSLVVLGATVPFTWGTGDEIIVQGFYEAA